jgi:hypothetical protein
MRQVLYITERTAILVLMLALTAGAQTPPAKPASQAPPTPAAKTPSGAKPAAAPAKTVTQAPAVKPAPAPQKPKPAPAKAPAVKKETPKVKKAAAPAEKKEQAAPTMAVSAHRRDPFLALVSVGAAGAGAPVHLPPGPGGLQVSTLRVEGVVRSPSGMLVVISNPQGRTYFLHQGVRLFDGTVEQISMDAVTFKETGKDPFGHPIDRTVVKRIYQSAGEQQ